MPTRSWRLANGMAVLRHPQDVICPSCCNAVSDWLMPYGIPRLFVSAQSTLERCCPKVSGPVTNFMFLFWNNLNRLPYICSKGKYFEIGPGDIYIARP